MAVTAQHEQPLNAHTRVLLEEMYSSFQNNNNGSSAPATRTADPLLSGSRQELVDYLLSGGYSSSDEEDADSDSEGDFALMRRAFIPPGEFASTNRGMGAVQGRGHLLPAQDVPSVRTPGTTYHLQSAARFGGGRSAIAPTTTGGSMADTLAASGVQALSLVGQTAATHTSRPGSNSGSPASGHAPNNNTNTAAVAALNIETQAAGEGEPDYDRVHRELTASIDNLAAVLARRPRPSWPREELSVSMSGRGNSSQGVVGAGVASDSDDGNSDSGSWDLPPSPGPVLSRTSSAAGRRTVPVGYVSPTFLMPWHLRVCLERDSLSARRVHGAASRRRCLRRVFRQVVRVSFRAEVCVPEGF